jgi:hypothetical protein
LKKFFRNNLYGILGTIIFHLILLIVFLIAKIGQVKKAKEQAIAIEFVQQLPDIEKIIEQKKKKLAEEMEPLSEQTRKNIAVNTADKLEKQISTKEYIDEVKKELGIKSLHQQLPRDINDESVNIPKEKKKEDKSLEKKYMGPTNITYYLDKRTKKYLPVPVYKCEGGGKVIVDIVVNQDGQVVSADISSRSSSNSQCLQEVARSYALMTTFNMDFNAPPRQKGYISYKFIPQ